jgi:hypothetical protein
MEDLVIGLYQAKIRQALIGLLMQTHEDFVAAG